MRPLQISAIALLTLPALAQKTEIRLDTGDAAGANFSSIPQMCANGDNVYVAWNDTRNGQSDIYFQRSTDRGESWLAMDVRLDTDTAGSAQSLQPAMTCFGNTIYVVWSDFRNGGSLGADLYMNVSTDGGQTWLTNDVRVDQDALGSSASRCPVLCADSGGVYVAWLDDRNLFNDVYFNRSTDNGATWLASDILVNTNGAGLAMSTCPSIACANGAPGTIYVGWNDFRSGSPDVYINVSTDGGLTFAGADIRMDTDPAGAASSSYVSIAAEGTKAYVAWWDSRNGADDIYLNYTTDSGATWLVADIRLDTDVAGSFLSNWPEVAVDGNNVYVVWEDWRLTATTSCPAAVFGNYSNDGGATWQTNDIMISRQPVCSTAGPDHTPALPQVTADSGAVFVIWTDTRSGLQDIYYNRSLDAGANWLNQDLRLDTDPAGSSFSTSPAIAAGSSHIYVAWEDDRNGGTDIFFNVPYALHSYGAGKAGTGGFVPSLSGDGRGTIGSTFTMNIDDVVGGAVGALLVGIPPRASLSLLGGTVHLNPLTSFPLPVGGPAGVGGAGSAALPLSIPNDEAFVGLGLLFQFLPIDSGATRGVSISNGFELRMG